MAIMISELYTALKSAGAPEHLARKAAEAVAVYGDRITNIGNQFARIERDLTLLKWMAGFMLATTVATLMLALRR